MNVRLLLIITLCSASLWLAAQPSLLEKRITLHVSNLSVEDALDAIAAATGCTFSYSPSIMPERTVHLDLTNRSVREALHQVLGSGYTFRERGKFIILSRQNEKKTVVAGYVQNSRGEPVSGAVVFDTGSLVSSKTDQYGYYEMRIEPRSTSLHLQVSKQEYRDTLIPLAPSTPTLQQVVIEDSGSDSTWRLKARALRDSTKAYIDDVHAFLVANRAEVINVTDTLYRDFQFSLLPFVGTNRRMSGHVINKTSINAVAGYSRGVNGLEIGGFANLNRGNVRGIQAAGFCNANGGKMEGVQAAGFANVNQGNSHGVLLAGFANCFLSHASGVHAAGFANTTVGSFKGVQMAGFANTTVRASDGISIAGFANVSADSSSGVQVAGFTNITIGPCDGVQVAGFANIAARTMRGIQLAPFNVARFAKVQIGVFNVADSLSGIPIGVFSYVHKGYHQLEISTDDQFDANIAFRTGVPAFYNILLVGVDPRPRNDSIRWSFGYGVGTAPKLFGKFRLNVDLTSQQIILANIQPELNLLNRLTIGAEWRLARRFSLAGAVVLNGYLYQNTTFPRLTDWTKPTITARGDFGNEVLWETWIGWKIAVRFF